jgi:hypothetical protein
MEGEPRSGRPCTSKTEENIKNVRTLVKSELSVVCWIWINKLATTLGCCMTTTVPFNTAISVEDVLTKSVFRWCPHIHLIWVRVTSSLSWNSNKTSKVFILKLWTTSKSCDRLAEVTSTWRLPALLPGVWTTPAMCAFPRGLLWNGWSWVLVQLLGKIFKAPVALSWK